MLRKAFLAKCRFGGTLILWETTFSGQCKAPSAMATSGIWEAVIESSGNTRLIAAEMSNFGSHMVGWKVIVNTKRVAQSRL